MPGGPPPNDRWPFSIDVDDLDDATGLNRVAELELPPPVVAESALAVGSEIRPRVVIETQAVPSDLDVTLMAYLLDIDVPATPVAPTSSADDAIDESPTPRERP